MVNEKISKNVTPFSPMTNLLNRRSTIKRSTIKRKASINVAANLFSGSINTEEQYKNKILLVEDNSLEGGDRKRIHLNTKNKIIQKTQNSKNYRDMKQSDNQRGISTRTKNVNTFNTPTKVTKGNHLVEINPAEAQAALRPIIVCVDGNIGAGKSTLLAALRKSIDAICFAESVGKWQNLLKSFYSDQKRWAFTLQSAILIDLRDQLSEILSLEDSGLLPTNRPYVIVERCPISAWCFVGLHHKNGNMNQMELNAYERLTHALAWEPDVFVYLKASPEICYQRCIHRSREGEECIPLSYLQSLHQQYENLFDLLKNNGKPVVTLDVEGSQWEIKQAFLNSVHKRLSENLSVDQKHQQTHENYEHIEHSKTFLEKNPNTTKVTQDILKTAKCAANQRSRSMPSDARAALLPHRAIDTTLTSDLIKRLTKKN